MKKILTSFLTGWLLVAAASCGAMIPRDATVITDHEQMMAILQEHFPD